MPSNRQKRYDANGSEGQQEDHDADCDVRPPTSPGEVVQGVDHRIRQDERRHQQTGHHHCDQDLAG